jgi:hypothetical protein
MQCINGHYVSGDYCFLCDELVRPPKEKAKGINKMSPRRSKESKEYARKKKKYMTLNPMCQAKLIGCTGKAEDLHHKAGRTGTNYTDEKTFMSVCRICHDQITNVLSAKEARELKLKL